MSVKSSLKDNRKGRWQKAKFKNASVVQLTSSVVGLDLDYVGVIYSGVMGGEMMSHWFWRKWQEQIQTLHYPWRSLLLSPCTWLWRTLKKNQNGDNLGEKIISNREIRNGMWKTEAIMKEVDELPRIH